jgi:hypothetical protein
MLASLRISKLTASIAAKSLAAVSNTSAVRAYSAAKKETDDEFDNRWESYFKKYAVSLKFNLIFKHRKILYEPILKN